MSATPPDRAALLAARLRDRAAELERGGRSPLSIELLRGAAASAQTGGIVAELFAGDALQPGSVPEMRLLGALHHLVLSGRAPQLAHHYPSAGGGAPPAGAWTAAERAIAADREHVAARIARPVQTNEPGRCAALYGGLLWLTERHRTALRLLEIGASAGLNLNVDRLRYVVAGATLGDGASPLQLVEPWVGAPVADPPAAAAALAVRDRGGCDPSPIDPTSDDGLRTLESYVWPDETERVERLRLAARLAAEHPVRVERSAASAWLARRLRPAGDGVLTVVWQSLMRQYLDDAERAAIDATIRAAAAAIPLAWLALEPGPSSPEPVELRCWEPGRDEPLLLATSGYHGPPVRWLAPAPRAGPSAR